MNPSRHWGSSTSAFISTDSLAPASKPLLTNLVKQSMFTHSSPRQIFRALEGNGFELLTRLSWNHISQDLSCIHIDPKKTSQEFWRIKVSIHVVADRSTAAPRFPQILALLCSHTSLSQQLAPLTRYSQPSMPFSTSFLQWFHSSSCLHGASQNPFESSCSPTRIASISGQRLDTVVISDSQPPFWTCLSQFLSWHLKTVINHFSKYSVVLLLDPACTPFMQPLLFDALSAYSGVISLPGFGMMCLLPSLLSTTSCLLLHLCACLNT